MDAGKISIVVPIYKVENDLDRCVKSIVNQTYHNLEIILVDDGSPDCCPEMCDEYAKQDDRIKVIHKKNGGLSEARNVGLKKASGEYIMYVDSDDYIEKESCIQLLKSMQTDIDLVVGVIREIGDDGITYQRHTNLISGKVYSSKEYVINSIKKNEWYAPAVLNLYRRDFLIKNNLFFKVGYYFEDIEMLPRLFLAAKKVVYVDYPFYNYVIRENSIMTSDMTDEKKNMTIEIYNEWMEIIRSVGDREYQRYLYGILVRYYLANARRRDIAGWKIDGMNFRFAWKYALDGREKLKICLFNFFPQIYFKLK